MGSAATKSPGSHLAKIITFTKEESVEAELFGPVTDMDAPLPVPVTRHDYDVAMNGEGRFPACAHGRRGCLFLLFFCSQAPWGFARARARVPTLLPECHQHRYGWFPFQPCTNVPANQRASHLSRPLFSAPARFVHVPVGEFSLTLLKATIVLKRRAAAARMLLKARKQVFGSK